MKYIVTGGAGFIGANLAFALQKQGHEVIIIDDFSSGHFKNLLGFQGDILAYSLLDLDWMDRVTEGVDGIFHQAAITDTTVMDQKHMMQINVEAFRNVLDFALTNDIPKVVYASSAGVYGNLPCPMTETDIPKPENVYGFSKAIMDNVAMEYAMNYPELTIIGLRYFNVYGPGEYYKGFTASMVYQLYKKIKEGQRPKIFKHGEQERDFVYVKDVVKANLNAMTIGTESCVVNAATGIPENFNTMVKHINSALGTNLEPEYIDNPYPFFQLKTQASMDNAKAKIGYTPDFSFEAGIKDYIKILEEEGR